MRSALLQILEELGVSIEHGPDARAEVARLLENPGIGAGTPEGSRLEDATGLPFVTIDGPSSKDLDQAIFVERADGGGFVVHYALADAAHFLPPTSALFREALARGTSFYLPGFSVPMLPRELSEGLISLNPEVERRALIFACALDEKAAVVSTRVTRARIKSRAKLSFGQVQALYDDPEKSPLAAASFRPSLELLREVGERRLELAEHADVIRYRRREIEIRADDADLGFVVLEAARLRVEAYNEQISVLVNREGGRLLAESHDPRLQPVYRVHPAPDPEKLGALRALTHGIAKAHGLDPARFAMGPNETLNDLLGRLPHDDGAPRSRLTRVAEAIERQAILVNMRSAFSAEPSRHFGVGAEVYARFTAPMREVVGVFLHKEMLELLGLEQPGDAAVDEAMRDEIVASANAARERQRRVNDRINRLVLDSFFSGDLKQDPRPRRRGTVMGLSISKVHVELDTPGMDVKVYLRDVGQALGGAWLDLEDDGAKLVTRKDRRLVCAVGDEVEIFVRGRDEAQDRWILGLERVRQEA